MPALSLIYWVLIIICFALGIYRNRDAFGTWAGDNFVYLVLFVILGIEEFGR